MILAAHHSDVWLGGLGLVMTGIAAAAIIARPMRTHFRLGLDSIALVIVYVLGIVFLTRII